MLFDRIARQHRTSSPRVVASDGHPPRPPSVKKRKLTHSRPRLALVVLIIFALWSWLVDLWTFIRTVWSRATSPRKDVRWILRRVQEGQHRSLAQEQGILGAVARVLSFRGTAKDSAVSSAVKAAMELLDENPSLVKKNNIDLVVAGLVVAKANPPGGRSQWVRPRRWGPCNVRSAGKIGGTLATAISELGYHDGSWPALRAVRKSLGCGKDGNPSPPIFAWEIGGAGVTGSNLWEHCVLAWASFMCVSGARPGTMSQLRLKHVVRFEGQCVWIVFGEGDVDRDSEDSDELQMKDDKRTAMRRPGRTRGLVLDNWRISTYFIAWMSRIRFLKFEDDDLVFPSIVSIARCRDRSAPIVDGFRVLKRRPIDSRGRIQGLDFVLGGRREDRTPHGFRHGQTVEFNFAKVSPVVRFRCQLRSLRTLIGSEASYDRVDEDAAREASRGLGKHRIVRDTVGMSVVATSASKGRLADWVSCSKVAAPDAIAAFVCQRCGTHVEESDEDGALCDEPACEWGLCGDCHPDNDVPLTCPRHGP